MLRFPSRVPTVTFLLLDYIWSQRRSIVPIQFHSIQALRMTGIFQISFHVNDKLKCVLGLDCHLFSVMTLENQNTRAFASLQALISEKLTSLKPDSAMHKKFYYPTFFASFLCDIEIVFCMHFLLDIHGVSQWFWDFTAVAIRNLFLKQFACKIRTMHRDLMFNVLTRKHFCHYCGSMTFNAKREKLLDHTAISIAMQR